MQSSEKKRRGRDAFRETTMARVVLVGSGPLPETNPESVSFPQLRCSHFMAAIRENHELALILLQAPNDPVPEDVECLVLPVDGEVSLEEARAFTNRFDADIVVGGGPYGPARVAAAIAGDRPLWIDIPGDPYAEAQAKCAHSGEQGHTREMRGAYAKAMATADAFSVVSRPQRHALLGQLGLLGRLESAPVHQEWVHILPVAYGFSGLPSRAPRMREPGKLVVALCGGYNTWTDGETLLKGLLAAMKRAPGLRVMSTGGSIPGHHSATYEAFRAQALSSPFAQRFTFHGWVPHRVLPELLRSADVGLCLDRRGIEPELGSRTRVLFYLHQGLEVVATPMTALCEELAGLRMIHPVPVGNPTAVADALVALSQEDSPTATVERAQDFLTTRATPKSVFSGFQQWLDEPIRVPASRDPAVELSDEVQRLRAELAEIHATPTWRAAGAADRILKRSSRRIGGLLSKD